MTDSTNTSFTSSNKQTSVMAIISLVSGIAGWTFFPIIGSLVAIVTGHLAKNEIRAKPEELQGDGFATAGLILGYLSVGLGILFCCLIALALAFFIPVAVRTGGILPSLLFV
jgi:dihydroorotate dehydrogenase